MIIAAILGQSTFLHKFKCLIKSCTPENYQIIGAKPDSYSNHNNTLAFAVLEHLILFLKINKYWLEANTELAQPCRAYPRLFLELPRWLGYTND